MNDDLAFMDAVAQAELVRSGAVQAVDLVDAAIDRIERVDAGLNAVIHRRFDRVRAEVAAGLPEGPFRGVPICIKDLDDTLGGEPQHEGNRTLKQLGFTAEHDSYLVAKLRAAGFAVVGQTNTPEWGLLPTTEPLAYGPTHNPWDPARSPGGSSGGSAAAVAAGLVPVANGGDGGGSIRIPASHCALVGLKPSRARVSLGPDVGEAWAGLVARHVLTRSVRDCATVLDVLAGPMPGDPYTAPPPERPFAAEVGADPGRLRIGLRTAAPGGMAAVDAACVAAAEDAARLLEVLGHVVEPASPTALDDLALLDSFSQVFLTGLTFEVRRLERIVGRPVTADDVEPLTWAQYEIGSMITAAQYVEALQVAHRWSRAVVSWWKGPYDLLLTPTVAEPPPRLGDVFSTPDAPLRAIERAFPFVTFTAPFNVTGQPAVSLPLWWTDDDVPVGVQLVADQYSEDVLLRVAAQIESGAPVGAPPPTDVGLSHPSATVVGRSVRNVDDVRESDRHPDG